MLKSSLIIAILALPGIAAASPEGPPCDQTESSAFEGLTAGGRMTVLAVGEVTKEKGKNLCAVIIDTSVGTIKLIFTTRILVDGNAAWQKVSASVVQHN